MALAAILAGLSVTNTPLDRHPILIVGAGSAGTGIAEMLIKTIGSDNHLVHLTDRYGVLPAGRDDLEDFQRPFARPVLDPELVGETNLRRIVELIGPAVIIGVSGQAGLFTEHVVRAMATTIDRPVVMPLSNPTSKAEAAPVDIVNWSDGRALVATGSPFDDVTYRGRSIQISQANNVYVFPGLGLGALAAEATSVTDPMLSAAAAAVAAASFGTGGKTASAVEVDPDSGLLPDLHDIHEVSRQIAVAVGEAAIADGVAPARLRDELVERVAELWWDPVYPDVVPAD